MKKIISCILTAALVIPGFSMLGNGNTAYAITYILDEQQKMKDEREHCWDPIREGILKDSEVATKKNAALFKELIEKVEITNDTTEDDIYQWLFDATEYSGVKDEGPSYNVYSFELTKATAKKEGSLKSTVSISQSGIEEFIKIDKVIAKLADSSEDEEEPTVPSEDLGADFDYKTAFQEAQTAIKSAMADYDVSNDTTKNDIIKMAENALPKNSKIKVNIAKDDFNLLKATTTVNGTLSATITLTCGTQTKKISAAKTIPEIVNETSKKIEDDRHEVAVIAKKIPISNRTTKEEILSKCESVLKNGSKISWKNFSINKATFEEAGTIAGTVKLVLGGEERETDIQLTIQKLVRKVPSDKLSLTADEWDILRLTNTARVAAGTRVITMTDTLQRTTDIRETELLDFYSHTRPNGELCFTALPSDYKYTGAGENIAQRLGRRTTPYSPEEVTNGWINSPDHYANMIDDKFAYAGIGLLSTDDNVVGVQMFTGGPTIDTVETSSGTFNFDNTDDLQKEYLICTAMDGNVSYLPLDIKQMKKIDGGYRLDMYSKNPVVFTIGEVTAASGGLSDNAASFADVPTDAYYADAVKWAVQNNVTTGTSATAFSPDDTCTRAQILTFMWRALGSPEPTTANTFSDVNPSDYYFKSAVWAHEKGMVSGTKFEADMPCKRSDTMKYFWLYAGSPSAAAANFTDVSVKSDYFNAVNWAVANGITSGTSATTFSPDLICSRAEIVTFLLRAINKLK